MPVAALFPGQGSLPRRLGRVLQSDRARHLLAVASEELGEDLADLATRGAHLTRTEIAQPLLAIACWEPWRSLAARRPVDVVAGHSFGDFLALAAAADLEESTVVTLAVARGRAFAQAARDCPGDLLALTPTHTTTPPTAHSIAALLAEEPSLALAAVNAPREWVISGPLLAIERVQATNGGQRLQVGGPWHHIAVRAAAEAFGARLTETLPPSLLYPYASGSELEWTRDTTRAVATTVAQCTEPVQWTALLSGLRSRGITTLVGLGPSRVLRALAHHNNWSQERVYVATTADQVDAFLRLDFDGA